jgi:hypothetical protein
MFIVVVVAAAAGPDDDDEEHQKNGARFCSLTAGRDPGSGLVRQS